MYTPSLNFYIEELINKDKLFQEELDIITENAKFNLSNSKQQWQDMLSADRESKEEKRIQSEVKELENRKNLLNNHKNILVKKVESIRKKVQKQKDALSVKKKKLEENFAKNEPELELYKNKLAIDVKGLQGSPDDLVIFEFSCIYKNEPSRTCHFILNVTDDDYKVLNCSPMVKGLNESLMKLNKTRDLVKFVKEMRKAFSDHAKSIKEKMEV
ncbi:3014_t:CDS:2 [Entrophospora sp. SA101]|nr:5811_t:CDS:2 [Entrophospora candida]CAH1761241.1 3014_t:CDS:2 [Entrophospora sp. SA101]